MVSNEDGSACKNNSREEGNRGISVVILGIIFMLVGLYFYSLFYAWDPWKT
jgi:hypothetical protein